MRNSLTSPSVSGKQHGSSAADILHYIPLVARYTALSAASTVVIMYTFSLR